MSTFHLLPDRTSNQLLSLIKSYFLFSSNPWGYVITKKSLCTLMNYRSMTVVCNTCRWRSRLTGYSSGSCGNALNPKMLPGPGTRTGWDLSPRCLARLLTYKLWLYGRQCHTAFQEVQGSTYLFPGQMGQMTVQELSFFWITYPFYWRWGLLLTTPFCLPNNLYAGNANRLTILSSKTWSGSL